MSAADAHQSTLTPTPHRTPPPEKRVLVPRDALAVNEPRRVFYERLSGTAMALPARRDGVDRVHHRVRVAYRQRLVRAVAVPA